MHNIEEFVLYLQMNHQRKADIDATGGDFELPTNSKTAYAWKIPKSFEVSGLIVSIQLLPSFRVPVDGDLVQSFGLA